MTAPVFAVTMIWFFAQITPFVTVHPEVVEKAECERESERFRLPKVLPDGRKVDRYEMRCVPISRPDMLKLIASVIKEGGQLPKDGQN